MAIPFGCVNLALEPKPSAKPATLLPARVVVTPLAGTTMRKQCPATSLTIIAPSEKRARATGPLKDAAVPVPSTDEAAPVPASVDTIKEGVMRRIR